MLKLRDSARVYRPGTDMCEPLQAFCWQRLSSKGWGSIQAGEYYKGYIAVQALRT